MLFISFCTFVILYHLRYFFTPFCILVRFLHYFVCLVVCLFVYVQPLDSYSFTDFKLLVFLQALYHSLCFAVICLMLLYISYLVLTAAPLLLNAAPLLLPYCSMLLLHTLLYMYMYLETAYSLL